MAPLERELLACLPHLRAFARALTKNRADADDLVQDAVVRILKSAHRFEPGTNFKAWAFTILRNRFLNEFVAKRRITRDGGAAMLERLPVAPRQEDAIEMADFLRIFHDLPECHRSILTLVAGSDMSYEDVAKVLNCATGTVKSRMHRARAALQALLDEAGPEERAGTSPYRFGSRRAASSSVERSLPAGGHAD